MVSPIIVPAFMTAGAGLWLIATGRPFWGYPKWPLQRTTLRVVGAYDLLGSLLVIGLAIAGKGGLAFVTYAVLTLVLVGVVKAAPNLKLRRS